MKLFVMPSTKVWYTGIALAGTCVVGAIIVGALHLHEKVCRVDSVLRDRSQQCFHTAETRMTC